MSFHFRWYYRPQIISLVKCSKVCKAGYFRRGGHFQGGLAAGGRQRNCSFILLVLWRKLVKISHRQIVWGNGQVELLLPSDVDPEYIVLLWLAYQVKLFEVVAVCFYVYMCYTVPQERIVMDLYHLDSNKGNTFVYFDDLMKQWNLLCRCCPFDCCSSAYI